MKLALWKNPAGTGDRVYLNHCAYSVGTKVWIQESLKYDCGWSVRTNDGDLSPFDSTDEIRALVISTLNETGIDGDRAGSWQLIVASIGVAGAKRTSARGTATKGNAGTKGNPFSAGPGPALVSHADELDLSSIKLPRPVEIRCDHREPAQLIEALRSVAGVEVVLEALPIGDFVLCDRVIVERKAVSENGANDFESSIVDADKRLFYQSERMKLLESDRTCVVLVEGDVYGSAQRMLLQAITGALSYLSVIQGMSVIPTLSLNHTAYFLIKLATHAQDGLGYDLALRGSKRASLLDQAAFVLEGLPKVSAALARVLLQHFGSIRAVANASVEQLREVDGIGPTKAAAIFETMNKGTVG